MYRIGQYFRQPVFSLPKCPVTLSLSSLVVLCSLRYCCVCFAADMPWHSLVYNFLCLLGLLCRVVIPNSLPFLISISPPIKDDVLPCSQRCRAIPTDTAVAAILFWRERTGPTDEAKIIHSFS